MSVPLDRLYNYLDSLCNHDLLIYRFSPHGSKNLSDLQQLVAYNYNSMDWRQCLTTPGVIIHDQEPLYCTAATANAVVTEIIKQDSYVDAECKQQILRFMFRALTVFRNGVYDKTLLVHSEKNSQDLD